jgi:hypothetical protein
MNAQIEPLITTRLAVLFHMNLEYARKKHVESVAAYSRNAALTVEKRSTSGIASGTLNTS